MRRRTEALGLLKIPRNFHTPVWSNLGLCAKTVNKEASSRSSSLLMKCSYHWGGTRQLRATLHNMLVAGSEEEFQGQREIGRDPRIHSAIVDQGVQGGSWFYA
ncbi:unnamed protein product [Lepidochelys kempii]